MNRFSSGAVVAVVGAVVLGAVIRGDHLAYVKDSLSIPLVVAAVIAMAVGLHECVAAGRAPKSSEQIAAEKAARAEKRAHWPDEQEEVGPAGRRIAVAAASPTSASTAASTAGASGAASAVCGVPSGGGHGAGAHAHTDGDHAHAHTGSTDGHGHSHRGWAPGVGWALLAPFLVLSSLPPTPAGSYAATRTSDTSIAAAAGSQPVVDYAELSLNEINEMRLRDYWMRAHFAPDGLKDRKVRLTGFAAADPATGESAWMLTRMAIMCCAADAFPVRVRLADAPPPVPANNSWVTIEGTWIADPLLKGPANEGEGLIRPPVLKVTKVTPIAQPAQPYE